MEVETLDCDVCGAKITDFENDLFHFSGKLKNKSSGHIHLCAKCKEDLKPPFFDFDEALQKKNDFKKSLQCHCKTDGVLYFQHFYLSYKSGWHQSTMRYKTAETCNAVWKRRRETHPNEKEAMVAVRENGTGGVTGEIYLYSTKQIPPGLKKLLK